MGSSELSFAEAGGTALGGPVTVFAAAGTYKISVQFRVTSTGKVVAKNRKLSVKAEVF